MTPQPVSSQATLGEVLLTDLWVHLGGVIAIAIGLMANKFLGTTFSQDTQLLFIIAGFAAMGVKLTNGTVAAVATAAAEAVKQTAQLQASATLATAAQAAQIPLATAAQAAQVLAEKQAAAPPAVPLPPLDVPPVPPAGG